MKKTMAAVMMMMVALTAFAAKAKTEKSMTVGRLSIYYYESDKKPWRDSGISEKQLFDIKSSMIKSGLIITDDNWWNDSHYTAWITDEEFEAMNAMAQSYIRIRVYHPVAGNAVVYGVQIADRTGYVRGYKWRIIRYRANKSN